MPLIFPGGVACWLSPGPAGTVFWPLPWCLFSNRLSPLSFSTSTRQF